MESGKTTSEEITRAYLDRVAAYDVGPFGFHSLITVAPDAIEQARAADAARAAGRRGELLGIPVAVKDLYDTKDMPTTGGSLVFDGFRPLRLLPGRQAARRRRGHLREGEPVGVRQLRLLLGVRLRPGVERLRAVEVVDRLLRRLGRRGRGVAGGGRARLADRRLAVGPLLGRLALLAARHRRPRLDQRRDAADLGPGLRRHDRPLAARPGGDARRHDGHRPGRRVDGRGERRRPSPGRLAHLARSERAQRQDDRLLRQRLPGRLRHRGDA